MNGICNCNQIVQFEEPHQWKSLKNLSENKFNRFRLPSNEITKTQEESNQAAMATEEEHGSIA